jgi:predicted phosphoribosyltransferase
MASALTTLRQLQPKRLIAAIGVAPPDTLARIEALADEVICLESPSRFYAVGPFFADFAQVEDEEVVRLLGGRTP